MRLGPANIGIACARLAIRAPSKTKELLRPLRAFAPRAIVGETPKCRPRETKSLMRSAADWR
jgi:hypothetical protein